MMLGLDTCLYCLEAGSTLRFDKHGRPFTDCHVCGARTFLKSPLSMRGLAVLVPHAEALRKTTSANAEARAIFDATVAEYQQRIIDRYAQAERQATQPAAAPAAAPEVPMPKVAGVK